MSKRKNKTVAKSKEKIIWVHAHWRSKPGKRKKIKIVLDEQIEKTLHAIKRALLRYTGSSDPNDLRLAGQKIKGFKLNHNGGLGNKYLHPSGTSKKTIYQMQFAVVNL